MASASALLFNVDHVYNICLVLHVLFLCWIGSTQTLGRHFAMVTLNFELWTLNFGAVKGRNAGGGNSEINGVKCDGNGLRRSNYQHRHNHLKKLIILQQIADNWDTANVPAQKCRRNAVFLIRKLIFYWLLFVGKGLVCCSFNFVVRSLAVSLFFYWL